MIKELTIYEVNGARFDELNEAKKYENLCNAIDNFMIKIKPRTKEVENGLDYIGQDPIIVDRCFKQFCALCATLIPDFATWFDEVSIGIRHKSHIGRVLSDYSHNYPILWETYHRFTCIDFNTGYEFQQPYFASHIEEAMEDIKRHKKYDANH